MSGSILPSDQSGAFGIVIGLIVMIMFGVLVTLLTDGSVSFGGGSRTSDAEAAVLRQEQRIADLTREIGTLLKTSERRKVRANHAGQATAALATVESLQHEEARHRATISDTRGAIDEARRAFTKYREDYRRHVWREAAGASIGELTTADGKTYHDVTVSRISEVGMAIRHKAGMARLSVSVLPRELRERFLLDATESAKALDAENRAQRREEARRRDKNRPSAEPEEDPDDRDTRQKPSVRENEPAMDAATRARVTELHRERAKLRTRQGQVRSDLATALSNAGGFGRDRSVPGSLDTWDERAAALQRLTNKLSAQISIVESELLEKDPAFRRLKELAR